MATTTVPSFLTLADLLQHVGDIPPQRIRLRPNPGEAVEQDVITIRSREGRLFELIDGVLVEKTMGFAESLLAMLLGHFLLEFVLNHDLGIVAGPDGVMRLLPGQVRIPDGSFISWDRLPVREVPREPVPDLAPDLAVEILSESNTPKEMDRKLGEYFQAGTRLVWFVDPIHRQVSVYTAVDQSVLLGETDSLDGGAVLPGFTVALGPLFNQAGF